MRKEGKSSKLLNKQKQKPPEKAYVIDTNIVINDPFIVKKTNKKIFIPTIVLSELDKHKHGYSEKAKNIREFGRILESNPSHIMFHNTDSYQGIPDEKIIQTAIELKKTFQIQLITNDILMGILAKAKGVSVKRYELKEASADILFQGVLRDADAELAKKIPTKNFNEYYVCHDGIYKNTTDGVTKLGKDFHVWGITHKNVEQRCALDALLDDNIKLVTLTGKAGSGKTLLALVAGLQGVLENRNYKRLMVARPNISMGEELGFLPGDINEKLLPWMKPIMDNIELLFDGKSKAAWQDLMNEDILRMEPLSYIRGRSIPNEYIIIDEAQNLSKHEVKTIISRAGNGTKIILTGDIDQIDNPKLDSVNNGLSYVIDKFKKESIAAHINFTKCERSELAKLAAELL